MLSFIIDIKGQIPVILKDTYGTKRSFVSTKISYGTYLITCEMEEQADKFCAEISKDESICKIIGFHDTEINSKGEIVRKEYNFWKN